VMTSCRIVTTLYFPDFSPRLSSLPSHVEPLLLTLHPFKAMTSMLIALTFKLSVLAINKVHRISTITEIILVMVVYYCFLRLGFHPRLA
jgi:hypothetical protein